VTAGTTSARAVPGIRSRRDQAAVTCAVAGGCLAGLGTTMTWFTIQIGGVAGPGGSQTGLEGRDGRTVLAAGVIALLAAGLLAIGRRRLLAKVALVAAGAVTSIVAVAGIVDALGKDEEVEDAFGIPADRVVAEVGAGLWCVAAAGALLLTAGVLAEPD
jgi:hypothetical protein